MILKIKLGDKLFGEIRDYLDGLLLDNTEGKTHDLMRIIASNQTPEEEVKE